MKEKFFSNINRQTLTDMKLLYHERKTNKGETQFMLKIFFFSTVDEHFPGRLMMKSVGVFNGYMNDPDKTNEALTGDGWYLTSDAGYIDADNHLVVVGR